MVGEREGGVGGALLDPVHERCYHSLCVPCPATP